MFPGLQSRSDHQACFGTITFPRDCCGACCGAGSQNVLYFKAVCCAVARTNSKSHRSCQQLLQKLLQFTQKLLTTWNVLNVQVEISSFCVNCNRFCSCFWQLLYDLQQFCMFLRQLPLFTTCLQHRGPAVAAGSLRCCKTVVNYSSFC